jgi:hypothetical protein
MVVLCRVSGSVGWSGCEVVVGGGVCQGVCKKIFVCPT